MVLRVMGRELSRKSANSGKFWTAPDKDCSAQLLINQWVYSDGTSWQPLWYWADEESRGQPRPVIAETRSAPFGDSAVSV
jgi:hypothetical protein